MTAHHVTYLPGSQSALFVKLDRKHVESGRWTEREYNDTRRYKADVYEQGFDVADDIQASAEPGPFEIEGWNHQTHRSVLVRRLEGNLQFARAVAAVCHANGMTETDIRYAR